MSETDHSPVVFEEADSGWELLRAQAERRVTQAPIHPDAPADRNPSPREESASWVRREAMFAIAVVAIMGSSAWLLQVAHPPQPQEVLRTRPAPVVAAIEAPRIVAAPDAPAALPVPAVVETPPATSIPTPTHTDEPAVDAERSVAGDVPALVKGAASEEKSDSSRRAQRRKDRKQRERSKHARSRRESHTRKEAPASTAIDSASDPLFGL